MVWLMAISLAYPSGKEGGNLHVQMISTCLHGLRGRGRGSAPCGSDVSGVSRFSPPTPFQPDENSYRMIGWLQKRRHSVLRRIKFIEGNANSLRLISYLEKFFAAAVYLSEGPSLPS